jgi:putative proteasome-type protease
MTYCVGMLVDEGLAMIADTRTNAGLDSISAYRKLHVVERPGERVVAVATAGNLSVTQTALALVREGLRLTPDDAPQTLETAPSLFRCAQLVGQALRQTRTAITAGLEADALDVSATLLLGGQIAGGVPELYLIYGEGNFIACGPDTPFLQVGELKYGKPVLAGGLTHGTPLSEAVKLGLISFSTAMRCNVGVGAPFDLLTLKRDALVADQRRIEADDPYFTDLHRRWTEAQVQVRHAMPAPPWMTGGPRLANSRN